MLVFEKDSTAVPLTLTIDQEGVGGVTGKSPTVAIRQANTLDSYLDFNDATFKTSQWSLKYAIMPEVERGHYVYNINISTIAAISVGNILSVEYYINDGSIVGSSQDLLVVVDSFYNVPQAVWDVPTATPTAGTFGESTQNGGMSSEQAQQLLEVYRINGLDPTYPLVVTNSERTAGHAIRQTIQQNVPIAGAVKVTRN